ncbi:TolC family protein [bacterium]|nr:TolC family protein [bacterium]
MKYTSMIVALFLGAAEAFSSGCGEPLTGAADTLKISLQHAVLLALDRNPDIAIQRLNPAISKAYAEEARAVFDPVLSASATRDENKLQRFLGSRPDPFEMVSTRDQYNLGISETLPTGTTISADASMSASISSIYTDQYSGNIGFTVTQSLLRGFGTGVNLAELRKARFDEDMSREEFTAAASELVASVEKAYWDLYLKADEIRIQKQSYDLAGRQLQETLERVTVGRLPELELASVRAEAATRRETLIDAESQYEQARLAFLFLLNPETESVWTLFPQPLDAPFIPADTLDPLSEHELLGIQYRPDLRQARLAVAKGDIDIVRTRNGLLPRLDLFITLGKTSYAFTFKDAAPDVSSPFYNVNAGVSFEFPVINREARAQVKRARHTKEQLELSLYNMERLVQWDIRSAYIEVQRARQQIEATIVTRELQEQNLAAELEKFRVGKSTNILVLQVQRDMTASRLDEVRAMVGYLNALIDLYLMEGTLLERRGIDTGQLF